MSIKCLMNGLEVNYPCSPVCALFGDCVTAFEAQKKAKVVTNADRIRAMSDEELAKILIFWNDDWGHWETDAGCIDGYDPMSSITEALKAELEWLKQPAEVEDADDI